MLVRLFSVAATFHCTVNTFISITSYLSRLLFCLLMIRGGNLQFRWDTCHLCFLLNDGHAIVERQDYLLHSRIVLYMLIERM